MNVLLSIKPQYAEQIFNGTKKYEYRKSIFKLKNVQTIIVYASSPIKQVIGEFSIDHIFCADVDTVWEVTKQYAGVSHDFYKSYFANKKRAYAIKIGSPQRYAQPRILSDYGLQVAPQSFAYVR